MRMALKKLKERTRELPSNAPTTLPLPEGENASRLIDRIDPYIAVATVALAAIGTVLVYSASAARAFEQGGDASSYLVRHLVSLAIGFIALAVALRIPVEKYSRFAYPLLAIAGLCLFLVLMPGLGHRVNGAVRWLRLGPVSFQPGELAKLAIVVYLAHSLAKKREKVSSFSIGFVPHVLVTSFFVAMILLQPDLGTSAVIYSTLGLMMFVAGTRIGYLVLALVAALPVGYHYVATHPHAAARLLVFMNPEAYKRDLGYQVWESIASFGSGGVFGVGLGAGNQKLHFLPEAHTDFIFSVLGQELGFVGAVATIALFAVLIGRGLYVARSMPCRFPMFLSFGICTWLGAQALVNMAVTVALLPTKGLTLPLISYGRSSIIVTLFAIGILLRASAELYAQSPMLAKRSKSAGTGRRAIA